MKNNNIDQLLREAGLKVTPQRKWVLEAIYALNNHPTAEQIINFIKEHNNTITAGTAYRVLDDLVHHELIAKEQQEEERKEERGEQNERREEVVKSVHNIGMEKGHEGRGEDNKRGEK